MVEVTTVQGKTHKILAEEWMIKDGGFLIVTNGVGLKTVFAAGQWESIKEHSN